jgi:orotate phosphoribosyltransferase
MDDAVARASEIAKILVRTGAVAFRTDPFFRFTSGVTSPVYVDNRQLLGHVADRGKVVEQLIRGAARVLDTAEVIAGTATAGIPWAAWIADRLELPLLYVRSEAKDWGRERAVEGAAPPKAVVVLVEDLAFSGGSLLTAAKNLREANFKVQDALSIVSYEIPVAKQRFEECDLRLQALTTVDEALAVAAEQGTLNEEQVKTVVAWLQKTRRGDKHELVTNDVPEASK